MDKLGALDYSIIAAYMIFALIAGAVLSKRASQTSESYFLGARALPWWMISISMIATSFASDTPLLITELTRTDGLQRIWWVFAAILQLIVGIFLFSRLWRRSGLTTDAEFYELRYDGRSAAFLRGYRAFMSGVIQNLIIIGWVTYAMTTILTTMTDIPVWWAIGACMAVALIYSTFSGFYGVIVTDFVQFFISVVSMLLLALIAVYKAGGIQQVLNTVATTSGYGQQTLSIFPDFKALDLNVIKLAIYFLVLWWSDANGYNMQRMSACRNERDSVKATMFYAFFQCCRPWLWVVVGLVSIVLFPNLTKHDEAYPMVMKVYLGTGLQGLLITAFLAAFMSTIDTHLNWGASYLVTDVYQRFLNRKATQRHYVMVAKISVILLMTAGVAVALFIYFVVGSIASVWEFFAYTMVGCGVIWVFRWFWWRINAYTEITAISLGFLLAIGDSLLSTKALQPVAESIHLFGFNWTSMPFEIKIAILTGVVLTISIAITFLTPPVPRVKLEKFYHKVRPGGLWSVVSPQTRDLPGKVLSWAIIIDVIGGILLCYGASVSIGYLILLKFQKAALALALASIGAFIVYRWYNKEVMALKTYDQIDSEASSKSSKQSNMHHLDNIVMERTLGKS